MSNRKKPAPKLTQDALNAVISLTDSDRIDTYIVDLSGYNLKGLTFKGGYALNKFRFENADLRDAKFVDCDLARYEDTFNGANLKGTSFDKKTVERSASGDTEEFFEAILDGAKNIPEKFIPKEPEQPSTQYTTKGKLKKKYTVYKKVYDLKTYADCIATLELTKGTAVVINPDGDGKCRAEKAKVISIENVTTKAAMTSAISGHDTDFVYTVGKIVTPTNGFDSDPEYACGSGIHFFFSRDDAENYC